MEISVKLHPKSSKREVGKISDNEYEAYVHSIPNKNNANLELVEILSEHFKVAKSRIRIIKGSRSKQKTIAIELPE